MAHLFDLRSPKAIDRAKKSTRLIGNAVCEFLSDGLPDRDTIMTPTWLTFDGGHNYDVAGALVRRLALKTDSNDRFGIGAHTARSQATFSCTNLNMSWTASIMIAKSPLPDTQLFMRVAAERRQGSRTENFVDSVEHVAEIWNSAVGSLGLTVNARSPA